MSNAETGMIADLQIMAAANNYQEWMYRKLAPFIGNRILEVGAGIGNFTRLLLDREFVLPTDISPLCIHQLTERLGADSRIKPKLLDLGNPSEANWYANEFDTVICLNVLEHVDNEQRALTFMHSILQPGGRALILVPAFMFLYGPVDASIGHFRRYNRSNLLPALNRAGFFVEHSFYMNVIGIAGWFWNNRIRRMQEEDAGQIRMFDRYIAPWAERVESMIPPPFGLSLIAVGRKQR